MHIIYIGYITILAVFYGNNTNRRLQAKSESLESEHKTANKVRDFIDSLKGTNEKICTYFYTLFLPL